MKKVTMQQIADALGLSKYAVSKALAGKEGVSPQTREKIIDTATRLGYFKQQRTVKNHEEHSKSSTSGQELRGHEKQTVAVLMPNIRLQTMDSTFWSMIVQGIGQALSRLGLGMLILTEQTPEGFERLLKPDSLLGVIGVGEVSTSMLLEIKRLGLPFVLTDHEDPLVPSDTVFASNIDSTAMITGYLWALGHRSFWFLGETRYSRSFTDRWIGFRKALEENGLDIHPSSHQLALSSTDRDANILLLHEKIREYSERSEPIPTAWVCANDEIAIAALAVLQEKGMNVPAAISVTGFDNIEESQRTSVPLTTVNVDKESLGERAVAALLDRVREPGRPREKINLACDFVVRSSTGSL
ncbi:LacI family DNA-binding transcriptional regulator [Paenibacillus sp. oral taxon 786]|uniref:LacI family DNA-binding transcriptional regulator n=1 Tax=Paenibacillus sp. oral taxon 786 TaxID=652715 RepID=UPI0005670E66|nr:LacI family DNA-binding transcriptional regulator [Paenibacillus sp. oral taxon 786]